jgi:hypothetical protein
MPGPSNFLDSPQDATGVCALRTRPPGTTGGVAGKPVISVHDSELERLLAAAWRALPLLPVEIREQVAGLLTKQAMLVVAGVAIVWAGSQFVPILGEVVDVVAGGLTWAMVGMDAIKGLRGYAKFYRCATNATTDAQLNQAAKYFADATISTVSAVGWARFAKWMGKGVLRAGKAAGVGEAVGVPLRWRGYIDAITFKVPRDRGMLWSSVGGPRSAERLAASKELITLEMELKDNGFYRLYSNEFGGSQTDVTGEIWKLLSQKYARSLEGRVTGYVSSVDYYRKLENAARARIIGEDLSVTLHDVRKMINPNDPLLVEEAEQIRELLLSNSKVTELILIDVKTGDAVGYSSREVLESLRNLEKIPTDPAAYRLFRLGLH